jgi:hypothetical protein
LLAAWSSDERQDGKFHAQDKRRARPPERSTLSRWLQRAARQGVVCRSGVGYRGDPFRYWLPGREGLLWPGDYASAEEKQAWRDRCAEHHRRLRAQPPSV